MTTMRGAGDPGEAVRLSRRDDGVYVVTFDRPDSSANVLDSATFKQLGGHLDTIEKDDTARAVIFTSAKSAIFIAGADVHEIKRLDRKPELARYVETGQTTMQRIAELRPVSVAAIHGACLGGGCELALACDFRVATGDGATRIGLPEVMLGIIPAWGGSTRLPRLIGLPAALALILAGKRLPARKARKIGLVDAVVSHGSLMDAALAHARRGRPGRASHLLTNNRISARIITAFARRDALATSRGHYPAIPAALEVVGKAGYRSLQASLAAERRFELELAETSEARNLIGVFLLQERAKRLGAVDLFPGRVAGEASPVRTTAVVGAGVMGAGIAQWLSARGRRVILRDISADQLLQGLSSIRRVFDAARRRGLFDAVAVRNGMDRISTSSIDVPLKNCDLVIEAAVERLDLKQKIFARLEELAGERTVLATNTSALSIDAIADAVKDPGRVIGLHFFNPVHRMQLVEIVKGARTDPEVTLRMLRLVQEIGKLPIVVKDSPGFLVNRILMPYLVEAGHLFAAGHAPERIDAAMLDFGMPMGPLRLLDEVGIDVAHHVASFLGEVYGDRMPVPAILSRMVEEGAVGRKAGRGFYVYSAKKKRGGGKPPVNDAATALQQPTGTARHSVSEMQRRMVLVMLNEAARCIEEEVIAAPEDVDLGMVMGTGFAPFRGGPMRYADTIGARSLCDELTAWSERGESRFAPCELISTLARGNKPFYRS